VGCGTITASAHWGGAVICVGLGLYKSMIRNGGIIKNGLKHKNNHQSLEMPTMSCRMGPPGGTETEEMRPVFYEPMGQAKSWPLAKQVSLAEAK